MPAGGARWKDVREFLDDMPLSHCAVKPPHEYCTICMRIDYGVANDCPLFSQPYAGGMAAAATPARPAAAASHEPVLDHLSRDDVSHALRGDDFPLIEFAGPRRAAVKAKAGAKAAPPSARRGDEEPLDVAPLEVVPLGTESPVPATRPVAEPGTVSMAPVPEAAPSDVGAASDTEVAPAAEEGQARPKVDPEELMHRIMEELEIPEDEEEAGEPGDAVEAGAAGVHAEERRDEGSRGATGADGGKPRVVEKRIVLRKRKKGDE